MDYEKIEAYCLGKLKGDELNAFEKDLKSNNVFKKEVAFFQENIQMLTEAVGRENEKAAFEEKLNQLGNDHFDQSQKGGVISMPRWIWAAASVAAIFLIAIFLWPSGDLYETYAQHQDYSFQQKGDAFEELNLASLAFNQQRYKVSEKHFTNYLNENPNDKEVQFALAICQMETEHPEKALLAFRSTFEGSVFEQKALWYEALCLLKLKREQECKEVLQEIKVGNQYFDQGQRLLRDLD